mgnify:CR=1 FL=1
MSNNLDEKEIIIVTGLPRSGTSLIMQVLQKIGVPILYDNSKPPDEHNPLGYFEYEYVKEIPQTSNWKWLKEYQGFGIKIISPILINIPIDFPCKIILAVRNIDEVINSQEKMSGVRKSFYAKEHLKKVYTRHLRLLKEKLQCNKYVKMIEINYNELLSDPPNILKRLSSFLGKEINIAEVSNVIDYYLYRTRCDN